MQYYNSSAALFLKPFSVHDKIAQRQLVDKRNIEFNELYKINSAKIIKSKNEIDHINDQIKKILIMKEFLKGEILKNESNKEKSNELSKRIQILDDEINQLSGQLEKLTEIYVQAVSPLLAIHYLSRAESLKLFNKISGEINDAIILIAKNKDLTTVVRSDFNRELFFAEDKNRSLNSKNISTSFLNYKNLETLSHYGPDYGHVFKLMGIRDITPPENHEGPKHDGSVYKDLKNENKRRISELLKTRLEIKDYPGYDTINSPIIYGGNDITRDVVLEILKNNNVSKDIINEALKYFSQN